MNFLSTALTLAAMNFVHAPMPHEEAVQRIQGLPIVTREVMDGLLPELRAYAFAISGVEGMDTLSRVRDMIAAVPAGEETWKKARARIAAELSEDLGSGAERRAELLLRTHTFRGYAATRYRTLMAQRDVFPYWQYKTHGDGKMRPSHAALNQKIFPAGHPIWQRIFPPWDWGCRCLVVGLMDDDVEPGALPKGSHLYSATEADVMNASARLVLPNGQSFSLNSSDTWGASPWSEKGNVRHAWAMIQERYAHDPEALQAWRKWADETSLGDGQPTVWEWVNGEEMEPASKATSQPEPKPAAAAAGSVMAEPKPEYPIEGSKSALRRVRKMLPKATAEDVHALVNAGPGELVSVVTHGRTGLEFSVDDQGPVSMAVRTLDTDGAGRRFISNDLFVLKPDGRGREEGVKRLIAQVKAAIKLGVEYLSCFAAKGEKYIGWWRWPQLGYNGLLSPFMRQKVQEAFGKELTTVRDILAEPGGMEWWKQNGEAFDATFDLRPGSKDLTVLERYAKAKDIDF